MGSISKGRRVKKKPRQFQVKVKSKYAANIPFICIIIILYFTPLKSAAARREGWRNTGDTNLSQSGRAAAKTRFRNGVNVTETRQEVVAKNNTK